MEIKKVVVSIVLVFVLIGAINFLENPYTGKVTTNIEDCYDSDGGKEPDIGGTLVGSYNPTKARKDFCVDANTVGEYYCDEIKSDGKIEEIECEYGCVIENGLGVCSNINVLSAKCGEGCFFNGACINVGIRVDGKYCDWDGNLKIQKQGNCENSYECEGNFCVAKKCLTNEQWGNFLEDIEVTHWWE